MKLSYHKNTLHNVYVRTINNFFIICFAIVLLLLSIKYNIVILALLIYIIYLYKKDKTIFLISLILIIVILFVYFGIYFYQRNIIKQYTVGDIINLKGKVVDIETKQYYQKITLKYKIFKVIIQDYEYNSNISLGCIINVDGINKAIDVNHIPYGFNYSEYFYDNLYVLEVRSTNIKIVKKEFSIYSISKMVENYLEYFFTGDCLIVLKGFIIGDTKGFSDSLNEALKVNGIIHLFAISGSHIALIVEVLSFLLSKSKIKNQSRIINIVLAFYLIITKFSVSISRAVFTYYVNQICKYKKIHYTSLDISCIVFIGFVIINPFYIYNLGFILSFLSTFLIILLSNYLRKLSNIKSIFVITLMINIFSLPIIINMNNEINLLSPFINIIMISIVEGMLIPLSFIVAVLPILKIGYTYIVSGFLLINEMISKISRKSGFVVVVGNVAEVMIIIYYILIILIIINLKNKKTLRYLFISFFLILFLVITNIKLTLSPTITFLDLYNGESTLIEYRNETILIDTGEGINNEVTSFLKAKGKKKIDYLILTHNHYDHNGEAKQIINSIKVTNIVLNAYDDSEFKNFSNTIFLQKNMVLNTKNISFYCMSPEVKSSNENNNSLVLYFKIENIKFLFVGDIEKEIEDILPALEVDVLKIAHHGSDSSSSLSFLQKMSPKYCVIMSGRKNKFGFPSDDVLNKIKQINSEAICTKDYYTIVLKIRKRKCIFKNIKDII